MMIKKIYKKYEIIFNVVLFSIFPIAAFYLMEFYEHNPFEEVRSMAGFFNIILFELIAWIFILLRAGRNGHFVQFLSWPWFLD